MIILWKVLYFYTFYLLYLEYVQKLTELYHNHNCFSKVLGMQQE